MLYIVSETVYNSSPNQLFGMSNTISWRHKEIIHNDGVYERSGSTEHNDSLHVW